MRQKKRATRAGRILEQFFDVVCQMTTWNFHIWASDDNASPQQKIFFILLPYMKNLRAKQANVHFAYFMQRDQYGIIAKHLT